jgi:hypothetical protein
LFFHSAQSNATAQQEEFESGSQAEPAIDSPLLLEEVKLSYGQPNSK